MVQTELSCPYRFRLDEPRNRKEPKAQWRGHGNHADPCFRYSADGTWAGKDCHYDFIIEKQKAELQRIEETKRHKEQQVSLAEQELKQVKAEIRTDKLKSVATDAATAIASGVGSLFGSGKLKDLEQTNENLRHEIAKRDKGIDELKTKMQQMQEQHSKQVRNLQRNT